MKTTATRRRRANRLIFLPTGRRCSLRASCSPIRLMSMPAIGHLERATVSELLNRRIAENEALDPIVAPEIDGRGGLLPGSVDRDHRPEPERVVADPVAGRQGRHLAVAGRAYAGPLRQRGHR